MRIITVITLLLLLGVSYGLYQLKYRVEGLQDRATALTRQTEQDQRAIKVLQAEWAYLTRPQRLQRLSDEFLHMDLVTATQIAALDELVMAPADASDAVNPAIDPPVSQPRVVDPASLQDRLDLPVDMVSYTVDGVVE